MNHADRPVQAECRYSLELDGQREFPKGLHGPTKIFDFYMRAVSRQVHERLRILDHRKVVRKVVDALAKRMAEALCDYLPMEEALAIVDDVQHSNGGFRGELLEELTGEGLLWAEVQGGGDDDHVVRFTFQRFSDHMIAATLLGEHVGDRDPAAAFSDGGPLHPYLVGEPSWRMAGVVEAFAVQLPERYGREIMDLAPDAARWHLSHAFRESLLWRDQSTFTQRTLDLVKGAFGHAETANVLLSIATEPDNTFNADFLDWKLKSLPMPQRDAVWSIPLAERAVEDEAASWTLIDWVWASGFGPVDDRRAELAGVALSWFLTTSHRRLRDRATKALTTLLAPRSWLMCRLLERFWGVDDDYLRERLLAAIYGGALQGLLAPDDLKDVTAAVYERLFADGAPPPNTLLRDHGRWLVEFALMRGACPEGVDVMKARPPYKSAWPLEIVPDEVINSYTVTYPRGGTFADDIVSSAVEDGDFARYIIDPYIQHWSPALIGVKCLPSRKDIAKDWQDDFYGFVDASADVDALERYLDVLKCRHSLGDSPRWEKTPERKAYEAALDRFREALTPERWEDFRTRAGDWWAGGMFNGSVSRDIAIFDLSWARRWVCMRAHDFGWSPDLHFSFDSGPLPSRGRMSNTVERIGKKYQWMALYELGGRLADNCAFIGDRWGAKSPAAYDGECFGTLRDLDPSLLIGQTHDDGLTTFPEPSWCSPILPQLQTVTAEDRLIWLYGDNDFIDGSQCLELTGPDGRRWLTLRNFLSAREWSSRGDGLERDTWSRISCFVVPRDKLSEALEALTGTALTDPHAVPTVEVSGHHTYFGEYPWHPELQGLPDWSEANGYRDLPFRARATAGRYLCEKGSSDYSIDDTVRVAIPAPWLCESMGLRLSDGKAATYVDSSGVVRFLTRHCPRRGPTPDLWIETLSWPSWTRKAWLPFGWSPVKRASTGATGQRPSAAGSSLRPSIPSREGHGRSKGTRRLRHLPGSKWSRCSRPEFLTG